ncbi:hypothetical protein [Bacterioplanoides sp. SCSIO 12839]|uniref:hypothetical protein n=1 Tax=Bacterioplanoides sp. SCSIO 12839 TaxID=2829569 RepID=UPI0021036C79|nr:hypothetical protein [Bacterioplanoides sp. SCSIO 12839]UTW47437.1 hypothetical protein KFF03_12745 [Bacterioplanoides sp. SCSIO 12839]
MSNHALEAINLRESFAGNMSFETTGNSLRNATDECSVLNSSSARLELPANSTIQKASLYWSGSGSSVDNSVVFAGTAVSATVTYTENFTAGSDSFDFFSAKADVTALVSNSVSANYTVSGLSFDGTGAYCTRKAAYGGWALVVVYENASEPLRVINVFDGFQSFRGQSITLTPNNFVIGNPANGGKHAHITWEGDQANSSNLGVFTEELIFNSNTLSHGSDNPVNNQFNSVSKNTQSGFARNTSGVDIDVYEIGPYISAGATSVSTTYSSGGDLVLLSAEIISIPNTAVADLSFANISGSSAFKNSQATINLSVRNDGPNNSQNNTEVRFPLLPGTSLGSFTGADWQCNTSGNDVVCIYSPVIMDGQQSTALQITLNTSATTPAGNNAVSLSVSNAQFDNIPSNNSATATITINDFDLSQSQKTVVDLNGGNVEPGDVLRYTFTIREAAGKAINNLSMEDTFPDLYREIAVVSRPAGSIRSNDNLFPDFTVSNINLAANSQAVVVVDIVLRDNVAAGTLVENTATIKLPDNSQQSISSSTLTVAAPFAVTEAGNKPLYLYLDNLMSRQLPVDSTSLGELSMTQDVEYQWNITPVLQQDLLLSPTAGGVVVKLEAQHKQNRQGSLGQIRRNHELSLRLEKSDGTVIASATRGRVFPRNNDVVVYEYHLPYTINTPTQADLTVAAGESLRLVISQDLIDIPQNNNQNDLVFLFFKNDLNTSQVILPVVNVINIENILFFDKAYSDNTRQPITRSNLDQTVFVNAEVTDPFGSFDITSANLVIKDSADEEIVASSAMSIANDSGVAQKTFEYAYSIPASVTNQGNWKFQVTAKEGIENTVEHQLQQTLEIRQLFPNITLAKSSFVLNDPINGTSYPKAIPGAEVVYQLLVSNTGTGSPDADTIIIDEEIPADSPLFVGNFDATGPVKFIDGSSPDESGLTFNYQSLQAANDDVAFSNNQGASFTYQPSPDAHGYDSNVTHIRFMPKGLLRSADSSLSSEPEFSFQYKVRVQ